MLSARAIYHEIRDNDETYRLFCSVAAKGETQGGWENRRIAALIRDEALRPKVERHGLDEDKHGRLFEALLRKRGLDACTVPLEVDYTLLLEQRGIGLSHDRLRRDDPLSDEEILRYLVHSRVTEQRAREEVDQQKELFGDDPELGRAIRMIADDEVNHLSFTHEELQRFCDRGYEPRIRQMLREYTRAEIETYRDVSLAVMGHMARTLAWPVWKARLLAFGIRAIYWVERCITWRRFVTIESPERPGALDPRPEPAVSGSA
ncbi:MAG: ferritin-like domain-containing protein [Myxococcota bacterium]